MPGGADTGGVASSGILSQLSTHSAFSFLFIISASVLFGNLSLGYFIIRLLLSILLRLSDIQIIIFLLGSAAIRFSDPSKLGTGILNQQDVCCLYNHSRPLLSIDVPAHCFDCVLRVIK